MRSDSGRRKRIQTLFLHPVESYRLAEAARLLGITPYALKREAEDDQREAYRAGGRWRFSWRQVALIAFAAKVLPPLLSLRSVTVRLPEYILRALETAAAGDGAPLDHFLHHELIGLRGDVGGGDGSGPSRLSARVLLPWWGVGAFSYVRQCPAIAVNFCEFKKDHYPVMALATHQEKVARLVETAQRFRNDMAALQRRPFPGCQDIFF